jgi:hypothetical protein
MAWLPGYLARHRQREIDVAVLAAVIMPGHLVLLQIYIAPDTALTSRLRPYAAQRCCMASIVPALHGGGVPFHVAQAAAFLRMASRSAVLPGPRVRAVPALLAMGVTTQAAVWTDVGLGAQAIVLYLVLPGSWPRSRPSWSASTCSPGTRSAGSPTSCSYRC